MRRGHFAALRPLCPVCRSASLGIATVTDELPEDDILEGILGCTNDACQREYPIVDGIPILVAPIRQWLAANPLQLLLRDDLSPELESLIGDLSGPGSAYDTVRQYTGIYAEDHYGGGGSAVTLLDRLFALPRPAAGDPRPALDLGCSTGGTTFALADRASALTLGVDLNFAMLRLASSALRDGLVRYSRRRTGIVYDRRELNVDPPSRELVDFWCCDAAALPFPDATFGLVASLNVVDCVAAPADAMAEIARTLDGTLLMATPYDWSPTAAPIEQWLGGHSQRGEQRGASEPVMRALLARSGLQITGEEWGVPWRVRLHERSRVEYEVHLIAAESTRR